MIPTGDTCAAPLRHDVRPGHCINHTLIPTVGGEALDSTAVAVRRGSQRYSLPPRPGVGLVTEPNSWPVPVSPQQSLRLLESTIAANALTRLFIEQPTQLDDTNALVVSFASSRSGFPSNATVGLSDVLIAGTRCVSCRRAAFSPIPRFKFGQTREDVRRHSAGQCRPSRNSPGAAVTEFPRCGPRWLGLPARGGVV